MVVRKRFITLATVACLLAVFVFLAHSKGALAATSSRYSPRANDVAIPGAHSEIDAPTSHFRILATGGNVDVTLENACDIVTAGVAGIRASVDGQTKQWPGACEGNDIVFRNAKATSLITYWLQAGELPQTY
jgi:hypothetical protein